MHTSLDSDATDSLLYLGLRQTGRVSQHFKDFAQVLLGIGAVTMTLTWLHVGHGEYFSRPAFCLLGRDERMYADNLQARNGLARAYVQVRSTV